jgi:hypothetical protein
MSTGSVGLAMRLTSFRGFRFGDFHELKTVRAFVWAALVYR